ncbi:MAG: phosphoglucosamine mutase [Acidobacteria bacterium]|nr:phosphoglucosamine mutase [Acidobacteriota bacterium]
MRELKISTSWVRGVVGKALTPELVVDFACAFGAWTDGGPVVIGRDTRRSSPMLRSAVIAGLLSPGCEVIDLGVCTTPMISFAVRELGCSGGISITGSHNDVHWNALKFLGPDGALLNAVKGEELLDIYHASAFRPASHDRLRPVAEPPDLMPRYIQHLLASLDTEGIARRRFRLALDFCNGAAARSAACLLSELGCTLVPLNSEPTGRFAHLPAPCPVNMVGLARLTRQAEVDLGAAINIDGDRVAFVLSDGEALSEECTLPLAALGRLERRPGPVATNLSSSRMIDAVAGRFGQTVLRAPVGESHVVNCALEQGAVLAGEGSGGAAALPAGMTFDALWTLGAVLDTMARSECSLAELSARIPRCEMRKGELRCLPDQAYRLLDRVRAGFETQAPDCSDGVRVAWEDSWLHVRVSTTEPLLRIIAEAQDPGRADSLFEQAMELARRSIAQELGR